MVKAELKVKIWENEYAKNNKFFGDVDYVTEFSECYNREYDNRDDIAPCGVDIYLNFNEGDFALSVIANRYIFEHSSKDVYTKTFEDRGYVYEVDLWFNRNKLSSVSISVWNSTEEFEDGEEPNNNFYVSKKELDHLILYKGDYKIIAKPIVEME